MGGERTPQSRQRPATIYDVAKRANVSHQTVSRYLSGKGGVRPANRERVEEALKALNYHPNMAARSLATSRSRRLAALVYELSGTGPGRAIRGANQAAKEAGYTLDIISLDPDRDHLPQAAAHLEERDLEGVLATAPTLSIEREIENLSLPYPVHFDQGTDALTDNGASLAMDHLWALGHRRVAHLAGPPQWRSAQARLAGYTQYMTGNGQEILVEYGDWTARSGYQAAPRVWKHRPTAVFAANDRMALGLLRWLHQEGIRVPDHLSIIGFDDIAEAEFFYPSLTSVRQDFDALGRTAALRLIAMIEGMETHKIPTPLPQLITRDSTRALQDT